MIEHYTVAASLGQTGLNHKIEALRAEKFNIVDVSFGEINQAGSLSTPYAANYLKTEPGWIISVENGVKPFRSIITGEMVTEM